MFFRRNKATSNDNTPAAPETLSVIAADMVIEGNITSQGGIQIDGTVRGTVEAALCIVGHDGVVEGNILADEVVVRGRVAGPIHGMHVNLQAGATVEGDVVNTSLAVEKGAHIHGSIWHSDNPLPKPQDGAAPPAVPSAGGALSYLGSPLWSVADDGFRPIKAVKPR